MLHLMHMLYHQVLTYGFNKDATDNAIDFPVDEEARGMDYWVSLFEVYVPSRGEAGVGMKDIYSLLSPKGLGMMPENTFFYASSFKNLLHQKIKAFRAKEGIAGSGGPRYASPRSGSMRFYGVRLPA
eukprot:1465454-Prymnesium_polylepis.1